MNDQPPSTPSASLPNAASASASGISIIIRTYNAEAMLAATLNSLLIQTHPVCEAVVINDGSTDDTQRLIADWSYRHQRFRALYQKNAGRQRGSKTGDCARPDTPLSCFWIVTITLIARIGAHGWPANGRSNAGCRPLWVAAHSPSAVYGPPRLAADHEDLFEYFAFQCFFPIHACVLRRDLAVAVGGFDASLTTCEDWDFFQRVALTGARFGRVPEILACFQVRANSASLNGRRCLADARVVLDRGHGRDPRLQIAAPVHAEGRNPRLS